MPCRSKKLISESKSAADGRVRWIWSKEICHVIMIEFLASTSLRSWPPSKSRRLVFLRSLFRNSARYCCTEHRDSPWEIYAAACTMASGMNSNAAASSTWSLLFLCSVDSSFFSKSSTALDRAIGSTGMRSFRSESFKADSWLRVVIRIDPFWH